jgi:quercetin dioxygenase-like cupin family protein
MEIEVLWMNDYLMVMCEVEKARRASQGYEKEEPLRLAARRPRRASKYASELEGGNDVYVEKNNIFIGPDDGTRLPVLDMVHKVTAESFGGALTISEWGLPPGAMIPPHTHSREDECNFVLEGELTCDVNGEIGVAPVGSYVLKPRGVPHALYNVGAEPVRVLEILTPSGLENYFDEYEEIVSSALGEDQHRKARAELGERYGITWHDERIPETKVCFGIGP